MSKRLLDAEEVKKHLNIRDFRNLSKDKIIEFVSAIPDMDKAVALKLIEQFPAFNTNAQVMVSYYKSLCEQIVSENSKLSQQAINGYKQTLDALSEIIKNDDLSFEERKYFAEKMLELSDKMANFDKKNKEFLTDIASYASIFIGGCIIVGAAILGVNIKNGRIPTLSNA